MDWAVLEQLLIILGGIIGTLVSAVWWLGSQFRQTRDLIYRVKDEILDKLEYHEKHDDRRFQEARDDVQLARNDIWEIRLRNAAIDGAILKRKIQNGSEQGPG